MRLSLRGGEKLYVNGAVLSVDRRVSIELLNDVTFLLEAHVLQASDATTPLRQLYFVVQLMLMDPAAAHATQRTFDAMFAAARAAFRDPAVLAGLETVRARVAEAKPFDALRELRALFPLEDRIFANASRVCAA